MPTPVLDNKSGIVFLVHGTRNAQTAQQITEALEGLCRRFASMVELPEDAVRYGFLEYIDPLLNDALEVLCKQGKTELRIVPLLLFPGLHLNTHVPGIAREVMQAWPGVRINVGQSIGVDEPEFLQLLLKKL